MANIKVRGTQHTYQVSEKEAQEIKRIWKDDYYKPDQKIDLGPLSFKKGDITLIETGYDDSDRRNIDLSDPIKREEVRQFEKELTDWQNTQPEGKQSFEHWCIFKKIIGFHPPKNDFQRWELSQSVVYNPGAYTEYTKKYSAMCSMRNFEARTLPPNLESQKETLFEPEEINVKDIPF